MNKNSQYFFMHIPKTGGTTFRHILYNYYEPGSIFPSQRNLKEEFNGSYPTKDVLIKKIRLKSNKYKIICGHYPYDIINLISQEYEMITFVRNPINRFISHLDHLQRKPLYKDINEIFDSDWNKIIRMQSKFFNFTPNKPNWQRVNEVIQKFTFIGINEDFNKSLLLYNKIFETNLLPLSTNKNKAHNRFNYSDLNIKNQTELIRHLSPEIHLYNLCLKRHKELLVQNDMI